MHNIHRLTEQVTNSVYFGLTSLLLTFVVIADNRHSDVYELFSSILLLVVSTFLAVKPADFNDTLS